MGTVRCRYIGYVPKAVACLLSGKYHTNHFVSNIICSNNITCIGVGAFSSNCCHSTLTEVRAGWNDLESWPLTLRSHFDLVLVSKNTSQPPPTRAIERRKCLLAAELDRKWHHYCIIIKLKASPDTKREESATAHSLTYSIEGGALLCHVTIGYEEEGTWRECGGICHAHLSSTVQVRQELETAERSPKVSAPHVSCTTLSEWGIFNMHV